MPRFTMESFMNTAASELQCGHLTRSTAEAGAATSPSQARHLKCIIGLMKPLVVLLLLAISVQAQSLADAARMERARRANLKSVFVLKAEGAPAPVPAAVAAGDAKAGEGKAGDTKPENAKAGSTATSKDLPKPQAPPPVDANKIWNDEVEKLRAKVRDLQDQETALQLQQNELTNQVFAPITEPAAHDRAQAQLGENQTKLAAVRADLDQAKKILDATLLQGPPKK